MSKKSHASHLDEAERRKFDLETKRAVRAISLFNYIDKKEIEFKNQRHAILKSIVARQRIKIENASLKWNQKLAAEKEARRRNVRSTVTDSL